jgi:hypothetical protein
MGGGDVQAWESKIDKSTENEEAQSHREKRQALAKI